MKSKTKLMILLAAVLVLALTAAAALIIGNRAGKSNDTAVRGEGAKQFTLTVTDYDGKTAEYQIRTDAATVGEALTGQGIVEGEEGPYGLYIKKVNGIRADYDLDGHYWAFYVNGEYAASGIDTTAVEPGTVYGLKVE